MPRRDMFIVGVLKAQYVIRLPSLMLSIVSFLNLTIHAQQFETFSTTKSARVPKLSIYKTKTVESLPANGSVNHLSTVSTIYRFHHLFFTCHKSTRERKKYYIHLYLKTRHSFSVDFANLIISTNVTFSPHLT